MINTSMFSVVIPLYNKANHIRRAVDSVLNQNYKNFELIIINDGSTDGGEKVIEEYTDKRIKLINQKNGGESAARNRGLEESRSIYVAFLDADDEWESFFLECISELILTNPNAGCYSTKIKDSFFVTNKQDFDCLTQEDKYTTITNYFLSLNTEHFPIAPSCSCVNKDVVLGLGGFNTELKIGPDIDMWIRIFLNSTIVRANIFAAKYYDDAENRSVARSDFTVQEVKFFSHLKAKYLNSNLKPEYSLELKKWISKKIYPIVIRSIYKNQKMYAARVFFMFLGYIGCISSIYIGIRLILPNDLVELFKKIRLS